jgi:hypothetical protein
VSTVVVAVMIVVVMVMIMVVMVIDGTIYCIRRAGNVRVTIIPVVRVPVSTISKVMKVSEVAKVTQTSYRAYVTEKAATNMGDAATKC